MIIGIVGSIASGKDTVADYLRDKGFKTISLSDILRGIMREEGVEITTVNMTDYGNKLRNSQGSGYLAKKALDQIKEGENVIITSIRQVGEAETLQSQPGFTLVKLDAPIEMRLNRLMDRNRPGDIKNMEELKAVEAKQVDGTGGSMNMNKCFEMATEVIVNDGTFEELYDKVDQLILRINSSDNN